MKTRLTKREVDEVVGALLSDHLDGCATKRGTTLCGCITKLARPTSPLMRDVAGWHHAAQVRRAVLRTLEDAASDCSPRAAAVVRARRLRSRGK